MGHGFGGVRIHNDARAARLARDLRARAFVAGEDIGFAVGQYEPRKENGRRLLAHELTHVIQQSRSQSFSSLQRFPDDDITQMSITPDYARALSDERLLDSIGTITAQLRTLAPGSPEYHSARSNLSILQSEAGTRNLLFSPETAEPTGAGTAPTILTIPTNVTYSLGEPTGGTFGWGPALGRSTAIAGARSLGYLISPPIRGPLDPFRTLASRLRGGRGPLGVLGETYGAERYISSRFLRDLRPRYMTESGELALREMTRRSEWLTRYGVRGRDLERLPGLIARMAEGGTLSSAEQALVQTFFRAHAEHGVTFASPAMSATARSGLSSLEGVAPFLRERPYVARIEVPSSAVGEVNAVLGAGRSARLVPEMEVLVFTDARGNVTNIRPNPTSSLGRAAPYMRWGGRALIVVGVGVSAYRIGTASEEELPRVIGEEAGGWAGGLGGAALVGAGCVALGIVTGGIGLFICGLAGGIAGGLGGSYVGGEIGESISRGRGRSEGWGIQPFPIWCFTGDTRVLVADSSWKPISEIEVGEKVVAFDESENSLKTCEVKKVFERSPQDYLKIELDNGITVKVTPRHRLLANYGWTPAGDLKVGDSLYYYGGTSDSPTLHSVSRITREPAERRVYDLSVEHCHNYFAEGVLAHNKLP